MLGNEMNDLTKILELEYTRCSSEKAPVQNERIFYPIYESVFGEPHIKEGNFIESIGNDFMVRLLSVGKFRDRANKFFILKSTK